MYLCHVYVTVIVELLIDVMTDHQFGPNFLRSIILLMEIDHENQEP